MRLYKLFLILIFALGWLACTPSKEPPTPFDTLQTYTQAIKKKDVVKMKALLTKGSLKMAEDEAKAQNVSLDEIILRETIFSPDQKTLKFRNEKIDGDNATIEVENPFGSFDRVPFVKEDGIWKIAKDKVAEEMLKQAEEDEKKLNEQMNQGKPPEQE